MPTTCSNPVRIWT